MSKHIEKNTVDTFMIEFKSRQKYNFFHEEYIPQVLHNGKFFDIDYHHFSATKISKKIR